MVHKEIGDEITFTTSAGAFHGVVEGRNWSFDTLLSYIVRHNGETIPVCPNSFKSQLAV
jgi:hypothetical protein